MKISDADAAHCEMHDIGGTCDHEHVGACGCCTILVKVFNMSFASFLNEIRLEKLNYDQLRTEINTMINAVSRLTLVVK